MEYGKIKRVWKYVGGSNIPLGKYNLTVLCKGSQS